MPNSVDPTVVRLKLASLTDPAAGAILMALALKEATAAEVAAATVLPVETVRRHLRRMVEGGLILHVGSTSRRGRSERVYRHDPGDIFLTAAEMKGLSRAQVEQVHLRTLKGMGEDASAALDGGTYGSRPDATVSRYSWSVDEKRLARSVRINDDLLDEILSIAGRASSRVEAGASDPLDVGIGLVLQPVRQDCWPRPVVIGQGGRATARRLSRRNPVEMAASTLDPARVALLDSLFTRRSGAGELARRTGVPLERSRAELRRLHDLGFVRIHDRRRRRGTSEYVYMADARSLNVSTEDSSTFAGPGLDSIRRDTVAMIFRDALHVLRSEGIGDDHHHRHISRLALRVDAQGYGELSSAMFRALEQLFELGDEGCQRCDRVSDPFVATSGMLLFERASL
jgi:DNA-binding transcriptional ArsR family regulator